MKAILSGLWATIRILFASWSALMIENLSREHRQMMAQSQVLQPQIGAIPGESKPEEK
ncbi:MAG: hypothetical protein IT581_11020 [Verrucomicrobiales bacterium]|nr:hypothetical protein [Verrucomicrobiales bacterium]